jgi:peptidoglycan/xylan/chitin deacetylase (PgdA/CDA1 family)
MMKHILLLMFAALLTGCANSENGDEEMEPDGGETETEESFAEEAEEQSEEKSDAGSSDPEFSYEVHPDTFQIVPKSEGDPEVALITIDDAPDGHAVEMAQTLHEMDAGAIFFVTGMFIQDEAGQEALTEIHEMGFEIGNHTMTHPYLDETGPENTREEIAGVNDLIESVTGERPRFFRAPFGINTDVSAQVAEEEGMTLMNWTYGYDWEAEYQEPAALADIMVNTELLTPGANLLMHDRTWTAEALPDIVTGLREKGYDIVDPADIKSLESEDAE